MDKLNGIYEDGWWVKVSPLARIEPERWVCSIYKRGRKTWTTESCQEFDTPKAAYDWAFAKINRDSTMELYA